jgi:hypothetical protein
MAQCPRCGSAAEVHSVGELADLARMRLAQLHGQSPARQAGSQQGWEAEPVAGPPPGPGGRPQGGQFGTGQFGTGQLGAGLSGIRTSREFGEGFDGIGDAIADVALGAGTQFIGRAIRRRMEKVATERVLPAVTQHADEVLQNQIAVAERYPDLRACFSDRVVFLAGGSQTLPMPDLGKITVAQADSLIAQLQG